MDKVNVEVVAQLSVIDVYNPKSQYKDEIIISREDFKNVLSYVDFLRLCYVISQFPELIP